MVVEFLWFFLAGDLPIESGTRVQVLLLLAGWYVVNKSYWVKFFSKKTFLLALIPHLQAMILAVGPQVKKWLGIYDKPEYIKIWLDICYLASLIN